LTKLREMDWGSRMDWYLEWRLRRYTMANPGATPSSGSVRDRWLGEEGWKYDGQCGGGEFKVLKVWGKILSLIRRDHMTDQGSRPILRAHTLSLSLSLKFPMPFLKAVDAVLLSKNF